MATYKEMMDQFGANLSAMGTWQKVVGGLLVLGLLAGMLTISMSGAGAEYKVLYSGLEEEDASEVIVKLKELLIPYKLSANGTTIEVPIEQVYETRLSLAGEGLPRGGGVGFEIFDKTGFGTTDFVQRLNYQRALQGELARTIRQFKQVREARVHLATPKESVFIEDEKPPTASISVKLDGRQKLSESQIQSIVNLVASAVPGLSTENITLVDTSGRLLYRKGGDPDSMMSASQLEYQVNLENSMRRKVEAMLEEVVGLSKVKAQVTAELDFNRVNSTEESFDPEGQVVRSEQMSMEGDSSDALNPAGIPGAKGELASFAGSSTEGGTDGTFKRNNITRNYEVSHKTTHVQEAYGVIKRLSVAVMVDGTYEKKMEDGKETMAYLPRTPEDMQWFDKLVKNAIGYDEERGDRVEVANMAFALTEEPEVKPDPLAEWRDILRPFARPVFYLFIGLIVFFLVIKPFFKMLASAPSAPVRRVAGTRFAGVTVGGEEEMLTEEELYLSPKGMTDKERIFKLAQSDPDRAADLVRRWLRAGG
ncbi:MAG: flagellar M-ring protein FliF [Proteobacteria bacterium]|nr:flagellar M-ring protein FliF [Pseudomonadota bacterium]MBU1714594.1 flagellar M-ring protein FliF [Pseudomonadota bacterium]